MRALTLALVFVASTAQAAEPVTLHCQRYESKCTGDKCRAVADTLREDTKKEILTLQKMEKLDYVIKDGSAVEITTGENPNIPGQMEQYVMPLGLLLPGETVTTMENKSGTGAVRERITIDNHTGFYTRYLMHLDGTIKDVPIGEPYKAFFGWCEEEKPAQAPTPAAAQ